jgi:hypothetical protein
MRPHSLRIALELVTNRITLDSIVAVVVKQEFSCVFIGDSGFIQGCTRVNPNGGPYRLPLSNPIGSTNPLTLSALRFPRPGTCGRHQRNPFTHADTGQMHLLSCEWEPLQFFYGRWAGANSRVSVRPLRSPVMYTALSNL